MSRRRVDREDMDNDEEEEERIENELEQLRERIKAAVEAKNPGGDPSSWWDGPPRGSPVSYIPAHVRTLKGHYGKVYAAHWAGDSKHIVSASQDGRLIVWNGESTNKIHSIPLHSTWVMTCAYETKEDKLVACGGLDNTCSVYSIASSGGVDETGPRHELKQHDGYLSCCRFNTANEIITSSGDSTCIVWDVSNQKPIHIYTEHRADTMSVAVAAANPNLFASSSIDTTARIWDKRARKSCMVFDSHESDVNSVVFFPSGHAIGTGSDDSTCKLFDMRACRELGSYTGDNMVCGITSVDFSSSGRLLFAGYDDYSSYGWDILSPGGKPIPFGKHENRVSCLQCSPDKTAIVTGSWDTKLHIYA